jgi:ADP-ribose pyrophosphatase
MIPASLGGSRCVHEGIRFDVHRISIDGADGRRHERDIVVHPGSVLIVPAVDEDHVILIRNHRASAGETLWELPAGTLEPAGEDPLVCAGREIIEETGFRAARLTPLPGFFACPGISTEWMHVFLARELSPVGQNLDATEQITPHVVTMDEAKQMICNGTIRDAKTIAGLLYYDTFVRKR